MLLEFTVDNSVARSEIKLEQISLTTEKYGQWKERLFLFLSNIPLFKIVIFYVKFEVFFHQGNELFCT